MIDTHTTTLPRDHRWVVVDVETSGLRPNAHRVLSVAALVLSEDGTVEREFSTLVNPDCDPGPVHVHNLTRERLAGAPRFEDISRDLAEVLDGGTLVAFAISGAASGHGYLQRLAVDPRHQRAGHGRALVLDSFTWMRRRRLRTGVVNTSVDNAPALALYEGLGFRRVPEQLVVMQLDLPPRP